MQTFVALFLAASSLRFASAWFLSRQSEPPGLARSIQVLSFAATFRKIRANPYGRILGYLFFLQIAVHVSGGFFTPFMLRQLELPYWSYMMIISTMVLAKALAMPLVLRLLKRFGLKNVLIFASFGIVPLPVAWLLTTNVTYLVTLQLVSGFFWAAHELSVFLILFGEIPEADRTSVLTEFNLFHTVGVVMGSVAGGAIFNNLGQNYAAYMTIFALSSGLRLACVALIPNFGNPIRKAGMRIYYRTLGVRPGGGGISRPIVTDVDEEAGGATQASTNLGRMQTPAVPR